ncbi:hypothetical protein K469DRAFT_320632 [Zopfia rhizophila CBS 207.26]|uniref:Uncharacterized protein n=1 Tax=Zopfia rhizophila CBS 207.26 TaxID=1314779 RepID=A0A6A6DIL8_9PEZI|nr:hypothetical protein K469DRAFT_320632 [Zopfia rhizophila CBS 207.26]
MPQNEWLRCSQQPISVVLSSIINIINVQELPSPLNPLLTHHRPTNFLVHSTASPHPVVYFIEGLALGSVVCFQVLLLMTFNLILFCPVSSFNAVY